MAAPCGRHGPFHGTEVVDSYHRRSALAALGWLKPGPTNERLHLFQEGMSNRHRARRSVSMAFNLYRNSSDDYVTINNGQERTTRVLLIRSKTGNSCGACVTSSLLGAWIAYPRQVFGFAQKEGSADIHRGGFDQGPFAWEDYAGDYYELSSLSMELVDKVRRILSDLDIEELVRRFTELLELLQHINWHTNSPFGSLSSNDSLTPNDKVYLHLKRILEILSVHLDRARPIPFS